MREMKDSGVTWMGSIPDDWHITKGRYCYSVQSGYPFASEKFSNNEGFPLIRIRDITSGLIETYFNGDYPKEYVVTKGDLLIGMDGDFNVRLWNNIDAVLNQRCCRIIESAKYDRRFLFYVLPFNLEQINTFAYATTVKHLSVPDLHEADIPSPSLIEQQRIVDFLDRKCADIDNVLEKTKASIKEYKKLKQSVITEAVTKGIRGERPMKESKIEWVKKIPSEWTPITPKALFLQRKDKAIPGERQLAASQNYGIIYQDDYMAMTGAKVVTVEKDFDILKHVEKGDFVISMRSFQGGLEYSENTGSISSAYVMIIPKPEFVHDRYYRWLFKSKIYIDALRSTSNMVRDGQAMRYSNFSQVRLFKVPLEEQKEIAEYLDRKCSEVDALIDSKERFIKELESYKKSLIYEYVTGKRTITE